MDLKGHRIIRVLGDDESRHANFVMLTEDENKGKWYVKFFTDTLHPKLKVYDAGHRELFCYGLSQQLAGFEFIPQMDELAVKGNAHRFIVASKHVEGDPLEQLESTDYPCGEDWLYKAFAHILVFSHWVRDYERTANHIIVDSTQKLVWSIDYQHAGPGHSCNIEWIVQPNLWKQRKVDRSTLLINAHETIGYYLGVKRFEKRAESLPRIIRAHYPQMLDMEYFDSPIKTIEGVTEEFLGEAFKGRCLYKHGTMDKCSGVMETYKAQLLKGQTVLRETFQKWIEWMKQLPSDI